VFATIRVGTAPLCRVVSALVAKNEEIRVLRMMLDAAKVDAATKEREKAQLRRKLKERA
jgi:hypothetical protein